MDIISVKPNELRLGNYINIIVGDQRNFTTLVVSSIGSNIFAQTPNGKNISGLYNDFAGIPLNEEWLLKFGWIWNEECASYEKYPNGDARMNLYFSKVNGSYTMANDVIKALIASRIFYVHQLQNLYFALTGEELTINENYK